MQSPPDRGSHVPHHFATCFTGLWREMSKRSVNRGDMWGCSPCGWIPELGIRGLAGVALDGGFVWFYALRRRFGGERSKTPVKTPI